jgi:hypothetical protein
MSKKKHTYRVTFHNQGKVYEVYAREVHQSGLFGFIEIEDLLFGEKTSLVVDPAEENLKSRPALVMIGFLGAGLFTARLAGATLGGEFSSYTVMALGLEIVCAAVPVWLLSSARARPA